MKKLTKVALLCGGLLLASSAYSAVANYENQKATCYIFKNDKLTKKVSCSYNGYTAITMNEQTSSSGSERDFTIPNYGKLTLEEGFEVLNDGGEVVDKYSKLNNKTATEKYRNKSLKIVSKSYAQQNYTNVLSCYQQSNFEFCYIDIDR